MSARELEMLTNSMLGGVLGGGRRRNLPVKVRWTKSGEDEKKLRKLFTSGAIKESTQSAEV